MARRLFSVTEVFTIPTRGIVLLPGIVLVGNERFRVGDPLLLKLPDGTEIVTTIAGLELTHPNPNREVVVVLRELSKDDVPVGTEAWSVDDEPK